jgi:membrane protein YdbS with pleckstrin-like domain
MGLAGVLSRWLGPKGFAGMIIVCIVLWILWFLVFDSIWFLVGTVIVSALTVVLGVGVFKKMMRNSLAVDESAADESDVMYNDPQYMDPNDEIQTMYKPNRL